MATHSGTTPDNGIKDHAKETVDALKDQVKGLVDAGQDKVNEVKDRLIDVKERVVDRADSFATMLTDKIKQRPLASVAVAFGIGYFAMRVFRR